LSPFDERFSLSIQKQLVNNISAIKIVYINIRGFFIAGFLKKLRYYFFYSFDITIKIIFNLNSILLKNNYFLRLKFFRISLKNRTKIIPAKSVHVAATSYFDKCKGDVLSD